MNTIKIVNDEFKIYLHIKDNKFWGYKFYIDNTFEEIDESVFNYFDMFILSDNKKRLDNELNYEVYLDNNTNFKHYFKDGKEDYEMFFKNNGKDVTCFNGGEKDDAYNINETKAFSNKNGFVLMSKRIFLSVLIGILIGQSIKTTYTCVNVIKELQQGDITVEKIKNMVYSSPFLSQEQKDYLYNPDFLNDILPIINESNELKYLYLLKFNDINIKRFENYRNNGNIMGYYSSGDLNTIYLKDNVENIVYNRKVQVENYSYTVRTREALNDTLSHEFVHLCQNCRNNYLMIIEACAEIISYEYFIGTETDEYDDEVKRIKVLMEIIGPDPIWYYNFSGDFSKIEEKVKPYLSEFEYYEFLEYITYTYTNDNFENIINQFDKLLSTLYLNKYGTDISNDEIINAIYSDKVMARCYFNSKGIHQDNSYYYDSNMSKEEAFNLGVLKIAYTEEQDEGIVSKYFETYQDYLNYNVDNNTSIKFELVPDAIWKNEVIVSSYNGGIRRVIPTIYEKNFDVELKK